MRTAWALVALLVVAGSPVGSAASTPAPSAQPKLEVVATFSTLGSIVRAVGGGLIDAHDLVPVGASPEDYQPTPRDIAMLHAADVLFENGGGLESWLDRTIANARNDRLRLVALSDGLPRKDDNPHLWMDPVLAKRYVARIATTLGLGDPVHRADYERNARSFDRTLDALRRDIARSIGTIPKDHRAMIVFHNAWQYYNDRFGIRTVGVVELSPGQEPSPKYIADLVQLARANHVRAVFAEPEYSPKLVEALAQSAGIATVENLYDDSIGASGPVRDYPSMLRYDTAVIVRALR
jgi:ABC-type Zn uptake system ZnuABC Zn-binding protein ZnuA